LERLGVTDKYIANGRLIQTTIRVRKEPLLPISLIEPIKLSKLTRKMWSQGWKFMLLRLLTLKLN